MKTFRIIGLVLMAIFIGVNFTSCKPDDKQEEPTKKLVKIRYINDETTFKYDDQGRLIESVEVRIGDTFTTSYTYVWGENTIDINGYINGEELEKCTLFLENGLASKRDGFSPSVDSTYVYNSSGRLVKCEGLWGTESIEWNDDNIIIAHDDSDISTGNDTYSYDKNYTTKGYNPLISNGILVNSLFTAHPELAGMTTQKLFNSINNNSLIHSSNTQYIYTTNYRYEFDEDGYVNKAIVTVIDEGETEEYNVNEYTFVWE
jgi:hypothetical protein